LARNLATPYLGRKPKAKVVTSTTKKNRSIQSKDLANPHKKKGPHKEVLIQSKNQVLPSLPIEIRIIGEGEEDWSPQLALEEVIKHMVTSLEENILKHKLPLKEVPSLKWSWKEESKRGSLESTILTHISAITNLVNIQNKKHLH
jgi:hypothetical protein